MKLSFREAENKDVEQLISLVDSAYRGESSRQGWTTEADLLDGRRTFTEEVVDIIGAPSNKIILVENDSELLASVHIKKSHSSGKINRAYLGMFAVSPRHQNKGIGKSVLQYVEKLVADEWKVQEVEMTVIRQRSELIRWYEKLGYRITGEKRDFPYGDVRYGIPKREDLELLVMVKKV